MNATFKRNLEILDENNICLCSTDPAWPEYPNSVELETYTDAGEDMSICLREPSKEELQEYIDNFDIDENVMLWWGHGRDAAHAAGVPFENISDHYADYRDYLAELQRVCNLLD